MSGVTIKRMKEGYSQIRNKALAKAFAYMNLIEGWGTGIPRLMREMKEYGLSEPEFIDMETAFRINLYRRQQSTVIPYRIREAPIEMDSMIGATKIATNATKAATDATKIVTKVAAKYATKFVGNSIELSADELVVLNAIRRNPALTQKELHKETGIALGTIKRILPRLQEKGRLERIGSRRLGVWNVIN